MHRIPHASLVLVAAMTLAACASPGDGANAPYDAHTPTQQAARAAADAETQARLAMMAPAGETIGGSRYDACFQYQNNWKIHDPYRIECHLYLTRAVAVANVVHGVEEAGRLAAQAGCPRPDLFADTLRYYTEANGSGANERYKRPTHLPEANFDCGADTRLRVQFLNPDARDDTANALRDIDVLIGAMKVAQVERKPYGEAAIGAALATSRPLVIVVGIDRRYHAVPW